VRCGILGGLFLSGTAVVGDGGKLFEWRCASFVHLVCVPLETREKDVLYVGFASEDVTLRIVRSCVALGISLCSRFLVCC
jgi:hypothetical protein